MGSSFRLACVQVNAGNEIGPNVETATALIREAASDGADFISLPECVALLEPDRDALFRKSEPSREIWEYGFMSAPSRFSPVTDGLPTGPS